jgi:hypothetical protein
VNASRFSKYGQVTCSARDINLIRDPNRSRPRLFIELIAKYIKDYLSSKDIYILFTSIFTLLY